LAFLLVRLPSTADGNDHPVAAATVMQPQLPAGSASAIGVIDPAVWDGDYPAMWGGDLAVSAGR